MEAPEPPATSPSHAAAYRDLVHAATRLRPLQQVHAQLLVCGLHRSRALITKLLTLASLAGSIDYSRLLFFSVPDPDSFLFNSLIRTSCKSGFSSDAIYFYRQMYLAAVPQSTYTFTSVIKACADLSDVQAGKMLHSHVLASGFSSDAFVQAALVSLYGKSGQLGDARYLFDHMRERSIIAWNAIISGYEQNGFAEEGIRMFYRMQDAMVVPDSTTLVSLLSACSQLGRLSLGQWVHEFILNNGLDVDVVLGTSLVSMYTRCGAVDRARQVFDEMPHRNVFTWTAMISGYGMHGFGYEAVDLFHQMVERGPRPNHVTFVAVLSACAHAGLINEGLKAFDYMQRGCKLVPRVEHHVCMVDMLGRAGFLNEAVKFIREGIQGEPDPSVWTALLGACRMYKAFKLGVKVAEHLLAVEPENPGYYVLLSNMLALAGRMDRVEVVRDRMISRGLKKQTGYSLIEIDGAAYMFSMGDTSHPNIREIYAYLEELMRKITEAGYAPGTDSVMHELEEEEREFALRFHSEKLAIAFGLMKIASVKSQEGGVIRIVKNLRMCDDCHVAIKFISVVAGREIIVRDKHRFHHFTGGACSCKDYW